MKTIVGGMAGGLVAYWFRLSVPLLGQLPFETVASRGQSLLNSLGSQIAGALGMQDNTGPVAIGGGSILAIIGLALAVTGSGTSQQAPPAPAAARIANIRSNWAPGNVRIAPRK